MSTSINQSLVITKEDLTIMKTPFIWDIKIPLIYNFITTYYDNVDYYVSPTQEDKCPEGQLAGWIAIASTNKNDRVSRTGDSRYHDGKALVGYLIKHKILAKSETLYNSHGAYRLIHPLVSQEDLEQFCSDNLIVKSAITGQIIPSFKIIAPQEEPDQLTFTTKDKKIQISIPNPKVKNPKLFVTQGRIDSFMPWFVGVGKTIAISLAVNKMPGYDATQGHPLGSDAAIKLYDDLITAGLFKKIPVFEGSGNHIKGYTLKFSDKIENRLKSTNDPVAILEDVEKEFKTLLAPLIKIKQVKAVSSRFKCKNYSELIENTDVEPELTDSSVTKPNSGLSSTFLVESDTLKPKIDYLTDSMIKLDKYLAANHLSTLKLISMESARLIDTTRKPTKYTWAIIIMLAYLILRS